MNLKSQKIFLLKIFESLSEFKKNRISIFILIYFYQLEANYFTILQSFLSYIDMTWIYMYVYFHFLCVQFFVTPWTAACHAFLSFTISQSLRKKMSIELMMPSNHLVLCHPLLLLPSTFSSIRIFSNESALCIRWLKYWSLSFSISPSNKYSGLISFRIDWFDLLAVQRTLKSLLQHHSSKASSVISFYHRCRQNNLNFNFFINYTCFYSFIHQQLFLGDRAHFHPNFIISILY